MIRKRLKIFKNLTKEEDNLNSEDDSQITEEYFNINYCSIFLPRNLIGIGTNSYKEKLNFTKNYCLLIKNSYDDFIYSKLKLTFQEEKLKNDFLLFLKIYQDSNPRLLISSIEYNEGNSLNNISIK
jgi:hypothetical protein